MIVLFLYNIDYSVNFTKPCQTIKPTSYERLNMTNGHIVPVSRRRKKALKQAIRKVMKLV